MPVKDLSRADPHINEVMDKVPVLSAALNIDTVRLDLVSFGRRSILQGLRGHYYSTCRCVCVRERQ